MMKPSTFFFLTGRGVRNMGKHWAMTIACVAVRWWAAWAVCSPSASI